MKILVIEDEANIRETIVDTLEFADYDVQSARNGIEGVKLAKSFEPALILCDVMMPELNGYGVLLELSQIPETSQVPFIFLTAKVTKEDMRKGMAMGADDYLTKPFTSQELLEAVRSRLERHDKIKEYNTQQMQELRQYVNMTLPHELRTPLTGMLGYVYMLEDGLEDMDTATLRSMVDGVKRSTMRLANLVENFVAYSQIQIIRTNPEIQSKLLSFSTLKDFDSVIFQALEKEAYAVERFDDMTLNVEPATAHIFHDHATKLISTIANNAFKFSEKGTSVEVTGYIEDDSYILGISNTGRGMTSEQITNIRANMQFDREKYEQQGAGLGLAIALNILEIYDGDMTIESELDGKTTVFMRLKLA